MVSEWLLEGCMGRELARGEVPTLILAILSEGPAHGYAIARAIEEQSEQALKLREGSLYPALRVLEQQGLVESAWQEPERGPARKTYTLTDEGRTELLTRANDWYDYAAAVMAVLKKGRVKRERSTDGTLPQLGELAPEGSAGG